MTAGGEQDCGVCDGWARGPEFRAAGGNACGTDKSNVGDVLGASSVMVPLAVSVTRLMP